MKFADFAVKKRLERVSARDIDRQFRGSRKEFRSEVDRLLATIQPGDELYYYCSDKEQWDALMGGEGYVVVRDGETVDSLVRRMN